MNRNISIDLRKLIRILHVAAEGEKSVEDIFKIYKISEPKNPSFQVCAFQDILQIPIGSIVEFSEESGLGKGTIVFVTGYGNSGKKALKFEKYDTPVEINNGGFPWNLPLRIVANDFNNF
jgi:hypothetical protein